METTYHKDDEDVSEEKSGNGYEEIGEEGDGPVVRAPSEQGCPYSDGERDGPGKDGPHDEKRKAIQKSFPDLGEDRLVVLPGNRFARKKIPVEISILDIKGSIQIELFAKTFHHFRRKFGIERVHLAGAAGREMNDQKRHDRNKEKRNDLLNDTTTNE